MFARYETCPKVKPVRAAGIVGVSPDYPYQSGEQKDITNLFRNRGSSNSTLFHIIKCNNTTIWY